MRGDGNTHLSPQSNTYPSPVNPPVPKPEGRSEDDGYLLYTVMDGGGGSSDGANTRLEILDALDLNKGPLCSIALGSYLPHGLYG